MVRDAWEEYETALVGHKRRSLSESVDWAVVRAKPLVEELLVLFVVALAPRRRCPYLAALGVPLAMTAAILMMMPLGVICALILCAWWFSPGQSRLEIIAIVGRALVGTAWALMGINLLIAFPHDRIQAGLVWAYSALVMASVAHNARPRR